MKTLFKSLLVTIICLSTLHIGYAADSSVKIFRESPQKISAHFPQAEQGFQKFQIILPEATDEQDLKVQLLIGKTMTIDCNQNWFFGNLQEKSVSGWGYTYFVLEEVSGPASTLIGCPIDSDREAFVQVTGIPLQRYNSKMPLVVYVPEGFSVKYRIWQAGELVQDAVKS